MSGRKSSGTPAARQTKAAHNRTPQRARAKAQARTLKAQTQFLREFAQCGNVLRSARVAKVGRRTVYDWLEDKAFKALYDEAHEDALDQLEEEARRRAVDGVLEPLVSAGKLVTTVKKYSDALLITLLKGKRPDTFRERHEYTGKDGKPIQVEQINQMTDAEMKARMLELAAKL